MQDLSTAATTAAPPTKPVKQPSLYNNNFRTMLSSSISSTLPQHYTLHQLPCYKMMQHCHHMPAATAATREFTNSGSTRYKCCNALWKAARPQPHTRDPYYCTPLSSQSIFTTQAAGTLSGQQVGANSAHLHTRAATVPAANNQPA